MLSKVLLCAALAVAVINGEPCPDGSSNEERCRGFCSDNLCVFSPSIGGYKKVVQQARTVKTARDAVGGAGQVSCVCKAGFFRKSVAGPCVASCGEGEVPVNTNVLQEVMNQYPPPPPEGPYPGPPEVFIPPPPTPAPEPTIRRELVGSISHTDDSRALQRDTMLANGMTVEQLAKLSPWYRLYNEGTADHFYTWVSDQVSSAIKDYGYRMEGISGKVATTKNDITDQGITCDRLKPLTQYFKGGVGADPDHFYTVKQADSERAKNEGYSEEGVAAYCVDYAPGCGATIPLHRFWSEKARDHIYITRYKDYNTLASNGDWNYEGVECYIWPFI